MGVGVGVGVGLTVGVTVGATATVADDVTVDTAAVRNGTSLVRGFPDVASATAVAPTAAASTTPLTRPDLRIPTPYKRDRPAIRISLDE